jgi:hypothetical protein
MSELDFETTDYAGDAGGADYAEYADYADFEPVEDFDAGPTLEQLAEAAEINEAGLAELEAVVGEFQQAVGQPVMTQHEWEQLKAYVEAQPGYPQYVSEQQRDNRVNAEIDAWLSQHPAEQRSSLFERAQELAQALGHAYGPSRELALAAMAQAAHDVAQQTQGKQEFESAADQAARFLGVKNLDVDRAMQEAERILPGIAADNPSLDLPGVLGLAIVAAVNAQHPGGPDRADPVSGVRQISTLRGPAADIANDMRARSLPKAAPTARNYRDGTSVTSRFNGTRKD